MMEAALWPQVAGVILGPLRERAGRVPGDVLDRGPWLGPADRGVRDGGRFAFVARVVGEAEQEVGVGGREATLPPVLLASLLGGDHLEANRTPDRGRDGVDLLPAGDQFRAAHIVGPAV